MSFNRKQEDARRRYLFAKVEVESCHTRFNQTGKSADRQRWEEAEEELHNASDELDCSERSEDYK